MGDVFYCSLAMAPQVDLDHRAPLATPSLPAVGGFVVPAGLHVPPPEAGLRHPNAGSHVQWLGLPDSGRAVQVRHNGIAGHPLPQHRKVSFLPLSTVWVKDQAYFSFLLFCFFRLNRAGLIHIALGSPGSPLPVELQAIKFDAAFIEIGENATGIHAVLSKVFAANRGYFYRGVIMVVSRMRQNYSKCLFWQSSGDVCRTAAASSDVPGGAEEVLRRGLRDAHCPVHPWKSMNPSF